MKTFQDFSPYNGLQWGPNGLRTKWVSVQLQRALNDTRRWIRVTEQRKASICAY